jgi:hypothetical protein
MKSNGFRWFAVLKAGDYEEYCIQLLDFGL